MIPWNSPKFGTRELELVKEVLETGYVSEGPKTKELEERLSKIVNAKHVIMTTSATAALYLAIEADKRIRDYDEGEAVTSNLTFLATRQAAEMANLDVTSMDVSKKNFCFEKIEKDYSGDLKIIITVNLLGRKTNLTNLHNKDGTWIKHIKDINEKVEDPATIICDNAGCLGSNVPNGKVGCYSLQANKLLTCGQGGFCATDDDEYAKVIRQIKDFGREDKYDQHTQGFNFKFNDIQAAVALGQLEQLEERMDLHRVQYNVYKMKLKELGTFVDFDLYEGEIPLWVEFITDKRDELYNYLQEKGIDARKPWKPLVDNPEEYPNTDYYCKNCLWLPNGASLTPKDIGEVIKAIEEFYNVN